MIKKKSNSFLSCDRKTSVNVVIWCPDETEYDEPVAVLQICHGMIEYIDLSLIHISIWMNSILSQRL